MLCESGSELREELPPSASLGSLQGRWALEEAGDPVPCMQLGTLEGPKLFFPTFLLTLQYAGGLQLGKRGPCFTLICNT